MRFTLAFRCTEPTAGRVGALYIVDHKPRSLSANQLKMLRDISRLVEKEVEQKPDTPVSAIACAYAVLSRRRRTQHR